MYPRAPSITNYTPTSSATPGTGSIVVTGSNFGSSGTVSVGSYNCYSTAWSDGSITCTIPPGQGVALPFVVTVSGQSFTAA